MWQASQPMWHGVARADVFVTDQGLAIAELNCDTPTGEPEAVVLGALALEDHPGAIDPNAGMEARFVAMVDAIARGELEGDSPREVGLVYPTEFTEDLSLVRLYRRWFESRGRRVVLGSPYNLQLEDGGLKLFDVPFSILLRHYKTDWWAERASPWTDEDVPDVEPLGGPLGAIFEAQGNGRCAVINPFGAVLPQNKRAMAFMWEHLHRFSPHAQGVIERLIPLSARLETMHEEQLRVQREDWVIKSDYGAEGDEVIIGRLETQAEWERALAIARPGRWIAQRYFAAETDEGGASINYGVYVIAGEACGLYTRVQAGPTDDRAVSAPVLIV
jgi:glutathionylspermidine synthase